MNFRDLWNNYLTSGRSGEKLDVYKVNQIKFINAFSLVGVVSAILFGFINIFTGNHIDGSFEIIFGIIGILNIIYFRKSLNYHFAANLIISAMIILLLFLLVTGGFRRTGIFWYYTFPPLAFFMKGIRRGFFVMLFLFAATVALYIMSQWKIIPFIAYDYFEIRQMLSSLFAVSMLVYFYEKVRWESENTIRENEKEIFIKNIFDKQFEDAGEIQRTFLPEKNYFSDRMDVVGYYKPAMEIGGDYFDFFHLDDDRMGIIIGDVSSKGIPAALIMVKLRTIVKIYSDLNLLSPKELLSAINKVLVKELMSHMFVTSVYLIVNKKSSKVEFSNAGHEPILHYSKLKNSIREIDDAGLPIGISSDENLYSNGDFSPGEGDVIVLYTDGITDMENISGEIYGRTRLKDFLQNVASLSAMEISENMVKDVVQFNENKKQSDDIALIVIKIK